MSKLALAPLSVQDLDVFANGRDLLRDLFVYVKYIGTHEVKRMVRTNELPKSDTARLAQLLGDPEMEQAVKETGSAAWISFIDLLALRLGLVNFDTKGEYRGYSSSSPSYLDNYVTLVEKAYGDFFRLTPAAQEKKILETLIACRKRGDYDSTENEFYSPSVLGRLDTFNTFGAAVGIMPTLDFAAIRRFLLALLQKCEPGVWYGTASLVACLKAEHPYFLIPEKIKPDRWGVLKERYSNFHDGPERWGSTGVFVPADAPDAFERVEGRYVERFLEGFPLTLRFVEVAYLPNPLQRIYPSLGQLQAFRVSERFLRLMQDGIQPARVTVQPNFDVIVESELYPARLMETLTALAEKVTAPGGGAHALVATLQLKKERVAAEVVRNPDLEVIALLQKLTGRALPSNVVTELEEWSGHADRFTLYTGFGLLESADPLTPADPYTVERFSPRFRLVHSTEALVGSLEKAAMAPLYVKHAATHFERLPEAAETIFPKKAARPEAARRPRRVLLPRVVMTTLHFPAADVFDDFRKALAEARCPIQADAAARTISFPQQEQPSFQQVLQQLAEKYQIEIEDRIG